MVAAHRLSGTWRGRLVDVQGFEGDLELSLKSSPDGRLRGTFNVEIGTAHSSLRQRGEVEGKFADDGVQLGFVAASDPPVKISLAGDVLELRDGGVGLRATYQVSARSFSPLQGGIACAAKDQKSELEIASRREWQ